MTAPTSSMTVPALSNTLKNLLSRAQVDNPIGDAREILCAVLKTDPTQLLLNRDEAIDPALSEQALAMARRRAAGEPIQYVIGSWSFMGRDYKVGEGVLIPRDDTEVVTRASLELLRDLPCPVAIDLCSGSGIIAITLEKEHSDATVYAVEKSPQAYAYLTQNIALNRSSVKAIHADLLDCIDEFDDGSLDMIVSNPPYIRSDEIAELQSEVQYEPRMALDGGEDGYDFYRDILSLWTSKLKSGGMIAFELGEEQYETVAAMLRDKGYTDIRGYDDIQGTARAVTGRLCRE